MERIYLDNAATSWPKPEEVYRAVDAYQRKLGAPLGRGAYTEALETEALARAARSAVAKIIGASDPRSVVFTSGGTESLNLVLHGLLKRGDHVVTTVVEHNSVLRPLHWLQQNRGVSVTVVTSNDEGVVSVSDVRAALRPQTRLVAVAHASNVTGALQPVAEIAAAAKKHGALTLIDAAQSLGEIELPLPAEQIDFLAAPGHKGLLGPLGTGVLHIRPGLEDLLETLREGGGGNSSADENQPATMPEKFEPGNQNAPGIVGLGAGAAWLAARGVANIRAHAIELTAMLLDGLARQTSITIHGPQSAEARVGIVSLTMNGTDPNDLAGMLDSARRIQSRAGLHCAPRMHERLGTSATGGTLRLSLSPFTTPAHIQAAISALSEIAAAV